MARYWKDSARNKFVQPEALTHSLGVCWGFLFVRSCFLRRGQRPAASCPGALWSLMLELWVAAHEFIFWNFSADSSPQTRRDADQLGTEAARVGSHGRAAAMMIALGRPCPSGRGRPRSAEGTRRLGAHRGVGVTSGHGWRHRISATDQDTDLRVLEQAISGWGFNQFDMEAQKEIGQDVLAE